MVNLSILAHMKGKVYMLQRASLSSLYIPLHSDSALHMKSMQLEKTYFVAGAWRQAAEDSSKKTKGHGRP